MDAELIAGPDGNYAICYKSHQRPVLEELKKEFAPLGLFVRADENKGWVFLRSPDKDVILNCVKTLGHRYNFSVVKNNRVRDNNKTEDKKYDNNKYTKKNDNYQSNENKFHTNKSNSFRTRNVDNDNDLVTVWETVICNLPSDFVVSEIVKLCKMAGVETYWASKHMTRNGHPYCSVYVTTQERVKQLCHRLQDAWYGDHGIIVADANDLYD